MKENKNFSDPEQFWPQAESLLDRHFRRKRILSLLLLFLLPALIGALSFIFFFNSPDVSEKSAVIASSTSAQPAVGAAAEVTSNREDIKEAVETRSSTDASTAIDISERNDNSQVVSPDNANSSVNIQKKTLTFASGQAPSSSDSQASMNANDEPSVSRHASSPAPADLIPENEMTLEDNADGNSFPGPSGSSFIGQTPVMNNDRGERIYALIPIDGKSEAAVNERNLNITAWPKTEMKANFRKVTFQATVYGSAHYVTKSLSTNNDWNNYMQHRRNEEDPIITPSFGAALSAAMKKFTVSIGAEYSTYGEKTNYYPYSLQPSIVESGNWQLYMVNYVDTDTAYVTGNSYLMQTLRSMQDSTFNSVTDTIEEVRYDRTIAERNGRTSVSYVEVPVEISYAITRGRAGVGVSGGVSPGWLVKRSGYYLRADGKGVESLEENKGFRKFIMNGRVSVDFYYRMGARTKVVVRPQFKTNLNSVFENEYGIKQKYSSTGILFGITYLLN
jgi:hypothetical protein